MSVIDFISKNFFHVCEEKTVLEIGPFDGRFSTEILRYNPSSLILLEAFHESCDNLLKPYFQQENVQIITGDMHTDLQLVGKVDVAVILGVIYHSHAPLYALEEIVNVCDPDIIIIDNPGNWFRWHVEKVNTPGMRYITGNKKTCDIVITVDRELLVTALTNLGYTLEVEMTCPTDDTFKKASVPIYYFKKL